MTDELDTLSSHPTPAEPASEVDAEYTTEAGTDPIDLASATPTPSRIHGTDPTPGGTGGAPPRTGRAGFKNHPPSKSPAPQKSAVVLSQKQTQELTRMAKRIRRLRDSCERLAVRLRNARLRVEQESKRATSELMGLVADMGVLEKQVRAQMGPVKRRVAAKKKSGGER